jgi:hypothetical protein
LKLEVAGIPGSLVANPLSQWERVRVRVVLFYLIYQTLNASEYASLPDLTFLKH